MRLQDGKQRTIEESLRRMEHLVSPRTGIARTVSRIPLQNGDPELYIFGVEMANLQPIGFPMSGESSGGAGLTYEGGKVSALGEMVERYCAAIFDGQSMAHGSYRELSQNMPMIHPERFALFSERQYQKNKFPFVRFTEDTPARWVRGYSFTQQREVLVPASQVYLPYVRHPNEPSIGPVTSTGLACGSNLEMAILSGLYECLERDAFTIFWLNELPVRQIDLRSSPDNMWVKQLFSERFDVPGYDYRVYEITNDMGVCSVYVVLVSDSEVGPVYVVGAATRLDGEQAVVKALIESVQGKPYVLHEIQKDPNWQAEPDFVNVNDFSTHGKLYTMSKELRPHLLGVVQRIKSTITAAELPKWKTGSQAEEIEELIRRFCVNGYEVVAVDLTTPDIESLGLKVVRVLTPELQQLHGIHRLPYLGGRRLYEVPVKMGVCDRMRMEDDLCKYPHPFP